MGISVTQLMIILAIIILLFGTKRLSNIGSDLGGAIKGFRSAVKEGDEAIEKEDMTLTDHNTITQETTLKEETANTVKPS